MSKWNLRDPSVFPAKYGLIVEEADSAGEEVFFDKAKTRKDARALADSFRAWRGCLRNSMNPAHRAYSVETEKRVKLLTRYDEDLRLYLLYVTVEGVLLETILKLNPELKELR